MRYFGRVFRPPSEAHSLILQATVGCSYNQCIFCSMYKEKQFHIRPLEDVLRDLEDARTAYPQVERIFIADGDALILPMDTLLPLLERIRMRFPECERVGIYGSPRSICSKTVQQLTQLREAGLGIVYLGLESGCEEVLSLMNKGETAAGIITAAKMVRAAAMRLSVTAISGLGGMERWQAHAVDTAAAFTAMKPDYIGLLTLQLHEGTPLVELVETGSFTLMSPRETVLETRLMLEHLDSEGSVFRSNHVSNYLVLSGTLNRDRDALIATIDRALQSDEGFRRSPFGF